MGESTYVFSVYCMCIRLSIRVSMQVHAIPMQESRLRSATEWFGQGLLEKID